MRREFTPRELDIFSELHALGYSQRKIADLSGVSQATISRLLKTPEKKKEKSSGK